MKWSLHAPLRKKILHLVSYKMLKGSQLDAFSP